MWRGVFCFGGFGCVYFVLIVYLRAAIVVAATVVAATVVAASAAAAAALVGVFFLLFLTIRDAVLDTHSPDASNLICTRIYV